VARELLHLKARKAEHDSDAKERRLEIRKAYRRPRTFEGESRNSERFRTHIALLPSFPLISPLPPFPFPFSLSSTKLYTPALYHIMSSLPQALPTLPSDLSFDRPKRKTATTFDHSDQEEEEEDYSKPRSKRNRVARATSEGFEDERSTAGDSISGTGGNGRGGSNGKALSEKEKDARRQARMIRNRSRFHLPRT
jgi:hypothetical protein